MKESVSDRVTYLFADTNLLIQCHPLDQLDWSALGDFVEISVVVSNPVLREIDYRKNKGNDRVGRRAREASALFREILKDGPKILRESDPRVTLSVEPHHQHSKVLKDRLNYDERDDQLVGTLYEFVENNSGVDARLFTHDTTPMFTAQGLDLNGLMIPDNWLRPPENTETEKEIAALRTENARLKKAEPSFSIRCVDGTGTEISTIEALYTFYEPLTEEQIDELMQRLKDSFPLATDFGPREPVERSSQQLRGISIRALNDTFVPVTDEEIEKYRNDDYPQWLETCEARLRNLSGVLQAEETNPSFVFGAENTGTRPATDALITITARGNFQIMPPYREDNDDDDGDEDENLDEQFSAVLPDPPRAPHGKWRSPIGEGQRALASIAETMRMLGGHSGQSASELPILRTQNYMPAPRDSNEFYYKSGRPRFPQDAFSLECDQWRHDDGEEPFFGEIHVSKDQEKVAGALECRVQAANLSQTASKKVPVRIAVANVGAFERASELVEELISRIDHPFGKPSGRSGSAG